MKIVLLGDRNVGKTSWINYLKNHSMFSSKVDDDSSDIVKTYIWGILESKIIFYDIAISTRQATANNERLENPLDAADAVILFYDATNPDSLNNLVTHANFVKTYNLTCDLRQFEKIKIVTIIGTKADQSSVIANEAVGKMKKTIADIINISADNIKTFCMSVLEPNDHDTFEDFKLHLKTQAPQVQENIDYEEKKEKLTAPNENESQYRDNTFSLPTIPEKTKQHSMVSSNMSHSNTSTSTTTQSKTMNATIDDEEMADKTMIIRNDEQEK